MRIDQRELRSSLLRILCWLKAMVLAVTIELASCLREMAALARRLALFGTSCFKSWNKARDLAALDLAIGESALKSGQGSASLRAALSDGAPEESKTRGRRKQLLRALAQDVCHNGSDGQMSQLLRMRQEMTLEAEATTSLVESQRKSLLSDDPVSIRRLLCAATILLGVGATVLVWSSGDNGGTQGGLADSASLNSTPSQQTVMGNPASAGGDERDLGFFAKDSGGRVVIDCVTIGGPATKAGMRLGDQLLAIGRSTDDMEVVKSAASLNNLVPEIGTPTHVRWQSNIDGTVKTASVVVKQRPDIQRTASLKFKASGYEVLVPWSAAERFYEDAPSLVNRGRTYEFIRSPTALLGRPDHYRERRIAVITELLPPRITADRIDLHLLHDYQSPIVHVERLFDHGLFNALIENDPATNPFVIMHVELRTYKDDRRLYGKLEEIMFLSPTAVDAFKPITKFYHTADERRQYEEQKKKREEAAGAPAANVASQTEQSNPLLTGSGSSSAVGTNDAPFQWSEVKGVLGWEKIESGERDGQRFVLESGRLMLLEGKGVVHVLASPHPEGRASLHLFLKSRLFTSSEQSGLESLLASRKPTHRKVGRFDVSIDTTGDRVEELPKHWLRLDIRVSLAGTEPTNQVAIAGPGAYSADELYTLSRHRLANKVIREALISTKSPSEIDIQVRMFNNLVDAVGLTGTAAFEHLDGAMKNAQSKGVSSAAAVEAATYSLAFQAALCKDELHTQFEQH